MIVSHPHRIQAAARALEELELELELELGVGTPIPLLELDCVGITPPLTVEVETADEDDVRGVTGCVM